MNDEVVGAEYRDVEVVSKFLNITPRRVQQLAGEGVIPKGARGKYHLVGSIRGYIKYLQDRVENRSTGGGDMHEERMRLTRLQSDELELRLIERKGQLVNVAQLETELQSMVVAFRTELQARDDKLKDDLDALYGIDTDRALIEEYTRAALEHLARYDPSGQGIGAASDATGAASTEVDDDGLGDSASVFVSEGSSEAG